MKYNLWYSAGKDQHISIDWDSPPRAILKAMLSKQPMTDYQELCGTINLNASKL